MRPCCHHRKLVQVYIFPLSERCQRAEVGRNIEVQPNDPLHCRSREAINNFLPLWWRRSRSRVRNGRKRRKRAAAAAGASSSLPLMAEVRGEK